MVAPDCKSSTEPSRAEARCQQVLDAAAECFRRKGFHGASMADISRAAGMSAGHIYNYFDSKDAIIGGIVEREMMEVLANISTLEGAPDVYHAMVEHAGEGMERSLDRRSSALKLEVLVESTRNPALAGLVHDADRHALQRLCEMIRKGRGNSPALSEDELVSRAELLIATFDGLRIRALRNPDLNKEAILHVLKRQLQRLLND
ncbi:TetR/AcrR family transcriptional regulator [Chitinimonas naiadis]